MDWLKIIEPSNLLSFVIELFLPWDPQIIYPLLISNAELPKL